MIRIEQLRFDASGLIPAVVQDADSGEVLMVAWMNRESVTKTLETGETHFWSRSRQELWHKGSTSGHIQKVRSMSADCDADTILVRVDQTGNACHTGARSCFFEPVQGVAEPGLGEVLGRLAHVVRERNRERPEGSYTTKLLTGGIDRILKKVGEESGEVIIAAKNHQPDEIAWEVADLLYHLLVMLEAEQVPVAAIARQLASRAGAPRRE